MPRHASARALALLALVLVSLAVGCADDTASPSPTPGADAGADVGTDPAPDASADAGSPGADQDGGPDAGPDSSTPPRGSFVAATSGGGEASTSSHRIRLSIGAPQPRGQARSTNYRLVVGPVVP